MAQELSLKSPKFGHPIDGDGDGDGDKFISGLSTVLVASIQEAKDRISQIEFLYCRKLYPNFQSKYKNLHQFYSQARKSLENEWKQKENELLRQIEKMRLENQQVLEENRLLKTEEAKVKEPLEKELLAKQIRIEELEREIGKKSEEIEEGLVLHKNLVELVQSKGSLVLEKESNLKHNVEKTKGLIARVKELEEEVAGIRKNLSIKTQEVEEKGETQKRLIKQIDEKSSELLENKKKLDVHEKEKQLLLEKMKCLEEKLNLPHKLTTGTGESSDAVDSYQKVLQQVESITSELQAEKRKRIHVTEAYKRLKSQHNYLREKVGLTSENMLPHNKLETKSDLHKSLITAPGKILLFCSLPAPTRIKVSRLNSFPICFLNWIYQVDLSDNFRSGKILDAVY